jgi:hypothetical protein
MIYPDLLGDSQEVVPNHEYPTYDNHSYNNTNDDIEIDTGFFYFLMCGLCFISFGGTLYRSARGCCQDIKEHRQRNSLHTYLTSRIHEESDNSDESCTICLETLTSTIPTIELQCNHKFHSHCITEWLERELICPNCRTPLEI